MMSKLKVAYFGTPHIAVPSLEALAKNSSIDLSFVGVFPDKPKGRKQILTPCPVKEKALALGLQIKEVRGKEDLVKLFEAEDFDLAIVIAFGMIFPASLFQDPSHTTGLSKKDIINVHFSLLPQYRGASPVQSAILNGDEVSGITFQRMVYELDAGDVLWQKEYHIAHQKTSQIWEKFAQHTAQELPHFLEAYQDKTLTTCPQPPAPTFCGKFKKEDGLVDLQKDSPESIYRKYLAFDIWPGIYVQTGLGRLKLTEIERAPTGTINILRAQLEGKKEMPIAEILRGHPDLLV